MQVSGSKTHAFLFTILLLERDQFCILNVRDALFRELEDKGFKAPEIFVHFVRFQLSGDMCFLTGK